MDINEIIDMIKSLEGQLKEHERRDAPGPCPTWCWCHWLTAAKTNLEIALRVDVAAANNERWRMLTGYDPDCPGRRVDMTGRHGPEDDQHGDW